MKQAAKEITNQPLMLLRDERFEIGSLELVVPAGTSIDTCMCEAAHYYTEAISVLRHTEVDQPDARGDLVWSVIQLCQLSYGLHSAAYNGLARAGILGG